MKKKNSSIRGKQQIRTIALSILLTLLVSFSMSQNKPKTEERLIIGEAYAKKALNHALYNNMQHNLVDGKTLIVKDSTAAIQIAEAILFPIYSKESIVKQRPYEVYQIDDYWVIFGTLPLEYRGGTFQIIIDARNAQVLQITHGR